MTSGLGQNFRNGLLADTNLLVLFIVGSVNPNRIERYKRTRQYSVADFEFLTRIFAGFANLCTVAHVLAEVSNLTDLPGVERDAARSILKETVSILQEPHVPSQSAAANPMFQQLGLTDAAISSAAREHGCTVLTDDLNLYLWLHRDGIDTVNFTHLRAREFHLL